jgi:O-antigen/teichoic acid export membrane protein
MTSNDFAQYGGQNRRLRDEAARGALWSLAAQWGIKMSGLVTFVILARILAPEQFGVMALGSTLAFVLTLLADFGFSAYLIQATNPDQRTFSTAFWVSVGTSAALALLLVALAWPLSDLFEAPEAAPVIAALSVTVLVDSLRSVPGALLKRRFQFGALAMQMLVGNVAGQIMAIGLALAGAGVWALVGQAWTLSLVSLLLIVRAARWRPSLEFSGSTALLIARYGGHVIGAGLAGQLAKWLTSGITSRYLGLTAVGYLAMSQRITMVAVETVGHASNQFANSLFASVKHDSARLQNAYLSGQTLVGAVAVPLLAVLTINAELLIPTLLGEDWRGAVPVFQLLALGGIGQVLAWTINRPLLLAVGRPEISMFVTLAFSITLVVSVLVTAQISLVAVAAAQAGSQLLFAPISLVLTSRAIGIPSGAVFWRSGRVLLLAAAAAIPSYLTTEALAASLPPLLATSASIAVYTGGYVIMLRTVEKAVWTTIVGMLQSLLNRARRRDSATTAA